MKKKIRRENNFRYNLKQDRLGDIDMEDFLEMNYQGLSEEEIAKELGIDDKYVKSIKNQFHQDY